MRRNSVAGIWLFKIIPFALNYIPEAIQLKKTKYTAYRPILFKNYAERYLWGVYLWNNIPKGAGKSNLVCSLQFVPGSSACKSQSCILNLEDKGLHCYSHIIYRFARHWQTSLWCLEYKVKLLSALLSRFFFCYQQFFIFIFFTHNTT